jgi:hypothetical protein
VGEKMEDFNSRNVNFPGFGITNSCTVGNINTVGNITWDPNWGNHTIEWWYPMPQQPIIPTWTTNDPPLKICKAKPAELYISDIEFLDEKSMNSSAFAKAALKKQPDLLYVRFKLVHEGANKNKDFFNEDDIASAAETPILKFLNWEHGEPTVGTIYHTEFFEADEEAKAAKKRAHIIAEAVVWKYRYPDQARRMVKRHQDGTLAFSMEAYFTEAECSKCGSVFAAETHGEEDYCECLKGRFDKSTASDGKGEGVYRILRGFIFGGAGVVEDPADVEAESLAMAKTKEVSTLADKIELTPAELKDKIKEAVDKALADATKAANSEEVEQKLEAALKDAEEKTAALKEATQTVETLTKERDEAKAELTEFRSKIEKEKVEADRTAVLTEAGYVAPDDEDEAKAEMDVIMSMDEAIFDFHVKKIKAAVKKEGKKEETPRVPATGSAKPAKASKKSDDELSEVEEAAELILRL